MLIACFVLLAITMGLGVGGESLVSDPDNPNRVILKKMSIKVDGRLDQEKSLEGDLLSNMTFVMKEGVKYKLIISFIVQRETVRGLKLMNKIYRKGIVADKQHYMVGSYEPRERVYQFTTLEYEFPSGMLYGDFVVKSLFTDDDKKEYLAWEWHVTVKKDWED